MFGFGHFTSREEVQFLIRFSFSRPKSFHIGLKKLFRQFFSFNEYRLWPVSALQVTKKLTRSTLKKKLASEEYPYSLSQESNQC